MFGTKGTKVEEGNANLPRPYFRPGIHVAKIVNVEYVETGTGTAKGLITFEGKPHGDGFKHPKNDKYKGSIATTDLWLTENSSEITNQTLAYMADTLGFRDALDAVAADDGEDFIKKLKPVLLGKVGRWKFAGEEIKNTGTDDEGKPLNNWFKTKLARYRFVEDAKIVESETKLKFDENNKYDMQRLEVTDEDIMVEADISFSDNNETAMSQNNDEPW